MEAALITGRETVELLSFDAPTPTADGLVVDIALCGICGTDVHAWQSGSAYTPAVCGHEWVGSVSAIGKDARGFSESDRVVVAVPPACGSCTACAAGYEGVCSTVLAHATGRHPSASRHGGFAPAIAVPTARVVQVNEQLNDVQAAQVEPATVTLHAVRKSGLKLGDLAVIQGAGPIGLMTAQFVRASGARQVVVVEPNAGRRDLALTLGADTVCTPDDARDVVLEATNGLGADIVYECAGISSTVQSAVDLARRGGSMCLIGLASGTATIDPRVWLVKEITVHSALAYTHEEFEIAMAMIADGRVRVEEMHTRTIGLNGLHGALSDLGSGSTGDMKILVDPHQTA